MTLPKQKYERSTGPLVEWLEQHGRTQMWLAHRLGISVATMSRIARGACMPRPRLAEKIQALTGVSVETLNKIRAARTPSGRADRIRYGRELIQRGAAIVAAASEETKP